MAWLSGWDKRVKITLSNTNVDAALSNFPVLVYLSASSGTGSTDVSCIFDELTSDDNRLKIAVTTSDGETECYVEIERWDDANEKAWLWIKVPSVAADAVTELYIYYDSDHADNTDKVGDIDSTPGHNVWDSNFKFVCHMRDATTSTVKDSTSNGNDGTKKGANEPIEAAGKIDKGQDFDGSDDKITLPSSDDLYGLDAITVEAVLDCDGLTTVYPGYRATIYSTRDATNVKGFSIWFDNDTSAKKITLQNRESGGGTVETANSVWANNTDYYVAVKHVANTSQEIWINNASSVSDTQNWDFQKGVNAPTIGTEAGYYWWNGIIGEFRISNIARTNAWLKATYYSNWDNIASYGSEETAAAGEDVSLSEAFSMGDVIEVTWNAQGVIAEVFSSDDYIKLPTEVIIEEAFSMDDSVVIGKVYSLIIEEAFSSDDSIPVQWALYATLTEALSSADAVALQWTLYQTLEEALSIADRNESTTTNIYGRFREPVNLAGNRISLKIQNKSVDQPLWLQDLGLLLFGREEYFENNKPTNLQSQHIQLKIQNNTASEILHLFDIGLRLTGYDQR